MIFFNYFPQFSFHLFTNMLKCNMCDYNSSLSAYIWILRIERKAGFVMALNIRGKKTSLEEDASIYQKRQDDLPEKERLKQMTGKQKRDYFKTYYLPTLLVVLAVAAVIFYIIWVDFINKSNIYMRCAILNESITDGALTEMSDRFTESLGMDNSKNKASFYLYYTRPDIAMQMGADTGSDLSEISSRLVANSLDCMIASEEDVKDSYMKNGFMMDLSKLLTKEEMNRLEPYLYKANDNNKTIYGIHLKQCPVYQSLFTDRNPLTEDPILFVITNATEEGKDYAKKLIDYLFSEELKDLP